MRVSSELTPEQTQSRLQILRDALVQITTLPNVHVRQNYAYLDLDGLGVRFWREKHAGRTFQTELLAGTEVKCTVCAKGAMFLAKVDRNHSLNIEQMRYALYDETVCEGLESDFQKAELDAIDYVFEDSYSEDEAGRYNIEAKRLEASCKGLTDRKRLVAMLKFLIANNSVVE